MSIEHNELNNKYTIIKEISNDLYLCNDKISLNEFLVKKIKLNKYNLDEIIKFINYNSYIKHKYIIPFIEYFFDNEQKYIFIVTKYLRVKTIEKLITEGKKFTEEEIIDISLKIIDILFYFEKLLPLYIYCNINPENVLIDENNNVYLNHPVNFTAYKFLSIEEELKINEYRDKNYIIGNYSIEQDIYSLGCLLLYIISHKSPNFFKDYNNTFILNKTINISKELNIVLNRMVNSDNKYKGYKYLFLDLHFIKNHVLSKYTTQSNTIGSIDFDSKSIIIENMRSYNILKLYLLFMLLFTTIFYSSSIENRYISDIFSLINILVMFYLEKFLYLVKNLINIVSYPKDLYSFEFLENRTITIYKNNNFLKLLSYDNIKNLYISQYKTTFSRKFVISIKYYNLRITLKNIDENKYFSLKNFIFNNY